MGSALMINGVTAIFMFFCSGPLVLTPFVRNQSSFGQHYRGSRNVPGQTARRRRRKRASRGERGVPLRRRGEPRSCGSAAKFSPGG